MIITHNDLDGFASALFASLLVGGDVITVSYSGDRDAKFKNVLFDRLVRRGQIMGKTDEVMVTDLSLNAGELEWARGGRKTSKWVWVDHHKTSENFNPDGIFDTVLLNSGGSSCATDLVYEIVENTFGGKYSHLLEWRDIAHDRDLWINQYRELGMKLDMIIQDANYRSVYDKKKIPELLRVMQNGVKATLTTYDFEVQNGIKKYKKSCELAQNTKAIIEESGLRVLVAYVDGQYSDVADTLYEDEIDIVAMINMFTPTMVINLRTHRDDIDLSIIAEKRFGGGGHKKAAGGKLNSAVLAGGYRLIVHLIVEEVVKNG